jgi:hypothetical protein
MFAVCTPWFPAVLSLRFLRAAGLHEVRVFWGGENRVRFAEGVISGCKWGLDSMGVYLTWREGLVVVVVVTMGS